jgi:general secretion pathway protein B
MSFILDALKKSEIERQRQSIPGLVDSGIVRTRTRLPMWAIALCGLLAINLIVLLFVLARGLMQAPSASRTQPTAEPKRTATAAGTDANAASTDAAAQDDVERGGLAAGAEARGGLPPPTVAEGVATPGTPNTHFSPLDTAPLYAPEIPVTATPAPQPVAPKAAISGSFGAHALHRRDPLLTDEDYKADDEEVLPTINEINLTGAQALPELHLDVHVYATRSAERFVYVNMRKYHEGATLQEGPTVERIRRDGVILNYHALRFLLPRQ